MATPITREEFFAEVRQARERKRAPDLSKKSLRNETLRGENLLGVKLVGADLQGCNLAEVNLQGANLTDVNWVDENGRTATLPDGSLWTPETDLGRFTNPGHPDFWQSTSPDSPAYAGESAGD